MSKIRMERRRKVTAFTPVYDVRANLLLGYLGDLTLKGGLLVSEKPIEAGRTMTLAIDFRDAPDSPPQRITVSVRVAWCQLEEKRTYYNVGMEFLEMTEENRRLIEGALAKFEFSRKKTKATA